MHVETDHAATTTLLQLWGAGSLEAREDLFERTYTDLKKIAGRRLAASSLAHELQTTEVVHEAVLRMVQQTRTRWRNRDHFFALAARFVRRVLLDQQRHRRCHKRGSGLPAETLDRVDSSCVAAADALPLRALMEALERVDPVATAAFQLTQEIGFTHTEAAAHLGVGRATVTRRVRFARAWLELNVDKPGVGTPSVEKPSVS